MQSLRFTLGVLAGEVVAVLEVGDQSRTGL
jgi:hypothetical protein